MEDNDTVLREGLGTVFVVNTTFLQSLLDWEDTDYFILLILCILNIESVIITKLILLYNVSVY